MKNKINTLRPEIIQQLLFSKSLLSQILFLPEAETSPFSIAKKILVAHDAAELGIAAIASQIGALPTQDKRFLMAYFDPIKNKKHKKREVEGKEYCRQLNVVRGNLKHGMILPYPHQWVNVGDKIYSHLSSWCQEYLKISLDDLDNSILINSPKIKEFYDNAKKELSFGNYRQVLELLAKATYLLFEENNALRSLQIGIAIAEDAIKLAAFGVHANDFLALQEFFPQVYKKSEGDLSIQWNQGSFGHPGNWREDSASFCMTVFLDLTLKIQNADWIPGPISFLGVYEYKIEAIKDSVEIWSEDWESGVSLLSPARRVVKVLRKGESIQGHVHRETKSSLGALGFGSPQINNKEPEKISVISHGFFGYVVLQDVKITCVHRENDFVKEHLPNLPNVDM